VVAAQAFRLSPSGRCARTTSGKTTFGRAGVQMQAIASSGKAFRFRAPEERGRSRNSA